jgi:NADPH:quinone reductase-like Zn-dependent oxidoreductase
VLEAVVVPLCLHQFRVGHPDIHPRLIEIGLLTMKHLCLRQPRVRNRALREDLALLAGEIANGRLHPHIEVEAPWTEIDVIARRLMAREFVGKAVLHVR